MRPNLIDDAKFRRVLGDELRTARTARGLVRRDIAPRLHPPVSLNTLTTYELGTRHMPVIRFVEICLLIDVVPMDILRRAYERVFTSLANGWDVDLAAATNLQDPALAPLAAWAAVRLSHGRTPGRPSRPGRHRPPGHSLRTGVARPSGPAAHTGHLARFRVAAESSFRPGTSSATWQR